jgi:hypothetical protein
MAHTYMLFDFANEEKAQEARHRLETWKQAFRLDKKLLYKLDRGDAAEPADDGAGETETGSAAKSGKGGKGAKADKAAKTTAKSGAKTGHKAGGESDSTETSGPVKLLVRLYFSGHEKKSEQQWLERIPTDEHFKAASPKVVQEGQSGFDEALSHFEGLE